MRQDEERAGNSQEIKKERASRGFPVVHTMSEVKKEREDIRVPSSGVINEAEDGEILDDDEVAAMLGIT